jgi:hypothetical protein
MDQRPQKREGNHSILTYNKGLGMTYPESIPVTQYYLIGLSSDCGFFLADIEMPLGSILSQSMIMQQIAHHIGVRAETVIAGHALWVTPKTTVVMADFHFRSRGLFLRSILGPNDFEDKFWQCIAQNQIDYRDVDEFKISIQGAIPGTAPIIGSADYEGFTGLCVSLQRDSVVLLDADNNAELFRISGSAKEQFGKIIEEIQTK